ncbi:MAG: HD-GYP domain-containing protein [Phycisphaerae bacterium]|jgi:HD-GYP domain-containing protein (c-di-GMP phosphodiesterase class II)
MSNRDPATSTGNAPQPGTDERLVHDLVGGLSTPSGAQAVSLGLLGCAVATAQTPQHCRHTCLGSEGPGACPFLAAATRGELDLSSLDDGRCARGYHVAAQRTTVAGAPAILATVAGALPDESAGGNPQDLLKRLEVAGACVQRVSQLLEENTGFAEEVLRNYEQLNLIFEVTQQTARVTDTRAIKQLLLERVGQLLSAETVWLIDSNGESLVRQSRGRSRGGPDAQSRVPVATSTVELVRRTQQVQVTTIDGRQAIVGPLPHLDRQVDVVLALAPTGEQPFTSGDMMLCESVLSFGGQILSNCELQERLRRMSLQVIRALVAAIDKKDHYTSGHSERVGLLTRLTAEQYDLSPEELQGMEWAGLLHDIGKIGIPEEILCKPGKLTAAEFAVIKRHPLMGHEILQPIAGFQLVLDGVRHHHEHPDGSGYPDGLTGDAIPLVARIIHVADTFDALTSTRSYRRAFSIDKAILIIREEQGGRIDSEAAEAFFRAFEAYRISNPEDFAGNFGCEERELESVQS